MYQQYIVTGSAGQITSTYLTDCGVQQQIALHGNYATSAKK
jgi:hypothetical protein